MDPNIWLYTLSTLDRNLDPENLAYTALWLAGIRAEHEVRHVSSPRLSLLGAAAEVFGAGSENGRADFSPPV